MLRFVQYKADALCFILTKLMLNFSSKRFKVNVIHYLDTGVAMRNDKLSIQSVVVAILIINLA